MVNTRKRLKDLFGPNEAPPIKKNALVGALEQPQISNPAAVNQAAGLITEEDKRRFAAAAPQQFEAVREGTAIIGAREKAEAQGELGAGQAALTASSTLQEAQAKQAEIQQIRGGFTGGAPAGEIAAFKGGGLLGLGKKLLGTGGEAAFGRGAAAASVAVLASGGAGIAGTVGGSFAAVGLGFLFKEELKEFVTNKNKINDTLETLRNQRGAFSDIVAEAKLTGNTANGLEIIRNEEMTILALEERLRVLVAESLTYRIDTDSMNLEMELEETLRSARLARGQLAAIELQGRFGIQ